MYSAFGDVRDHIASHKNDFVSALGSFAVIETSKDQLSRDFWCRSIFDFFNSILRLADIVRSARLSGWCVNRVALTPWRPLPVYSGFCCKTLRFSGCEASLGELWLVPLSFKAFKPPYQARGGSDNRLGSSPR
jgi:hypothetical protein